MLFIELHGYSTGALWQRIYCSDKSSLQELEEIDYHRDPLQQLYRLFFFWSLLSLLPYKFHAYREFGLLQVNRLTFDLCIQDSKQGIAIIF